LIQADDKVAPKGYNDSTLQVTSLKEGANSGRIALETGEGAGSVFGVVLPVTQPPSKGAKG